MQDGDISSTEFYWLLKDVKNYRKIKSEIRNQAKTKVKQITKQHREEPLDQKRNVDKEIFF